MLIRFITSNFLSFKDEVEFSMIPGRAKKHPQHIIKGNDKNSISTLKTGVIYGANASGKSNLIKAMHFAHDLIIQGTRPRRPIPVTPFKLDPDTAGQPAKFEFEFSYKGTAYNYGFEADKERVQTEWLYKITKTTSKMLFERETSADLNTSVAFGKGVSFQDQDDEQFVKFTARGTRYNQLFLSECTERDVTHFQDVFDWFREKLVFIFPDTSFAGLEFGLKEHDVFRQKLLSLLQSFDIGISDLHLAESNLERELEDLPEQVRARITEDLSQEEYGIITAPNDHRYLITRDGTGEIQLAKLMTKHKTSSGEVDILFEIDEESDGTQRLLHLIPALMELVSGSRTYIIDELDRSLHPGISYKFLEFFLQESQDQASQLVVTTHESGLLNLTLLRRDEIWFVEKDRTGVSSLYSLEEFAPRYDKDIRKGYLQGRFGAIPIIQNPSHLGWVK